MIFSLSWIYFVAYVSSCICFSFGLHIDDSHYKGIIVSFSSAISDSDVRFEQLKLILSRSSTYLFHATRRRAYFSELIFVLPFSWSLNICKKEDVISHISGSPAIYIHGSSRAVAQNSRGCSAKGDIIYMPVSWLTDSLDKTVGHSRHFVQLWSTFRYGVFEEIASESDECFSEDGLSWSPTGCYNLNIDAQWRLDEDGRPKCSFGDDFLQNSNLKSSIMFDISPPNMTEFCDESMYPHNPVMPTQQNILCNGLPVWKVIENTDDFIHGKNPSKNSDFVVPEPSFKCFYEKYPSIFIAVQDGAVFDLDIITEIRYVLQRFLLYGIPSSSKAVLVTYSNAVLTDTSQPYDLDLSNKQSVADILKENVRFADHVDTVCISCGLRKVIKAANSSEDFGIIVFMAFISDLKSTSAVSLWEELKYTKQKIYLISVQDTVDENISADIVDVMHRVGGEIFSLSSIPVFLNLELNGILLQVHKSHYHIEEDVITVHQNVFSDIQSNFTDVFAADTSVPTQLLYTLRCNDSERVSSTACSSIDYLTNQGPYDCAFIADINSTTAWEFNFKYLRSPKNLTCVSLATLHVKDPAEKNVILRGWLNEYEVNPKKNALVVYAEVLKDFTPLESTVEAIVHRMSSDFSESYSVELYDSGNGDPDIKKHDGIYSRYLPFRFKKGMYSVLIKVKRKCFITRDGDVNFSSICIQFKNMQSFFVTEDFQELDIYPPNRVADVRVLAVDHENSTVTLQWTAPGDDYDNGQASEYVIKYAKSHENLTEDKFILADSLPVAVLQKEMRPAVSGTIEVKKFSLPFSENNATYFAALSSIDSSKKYSKVSNIIQIYLAAHEKQTTVTTGTMTEITDHDNATVTDCCTTSDNSTVGTDVVGNHTIVTTSTPVVETATPTADSANVTSKDCMDKDYFILMVSSIGGGLLLFIIVINIIVCIVCKRRLEKRSKQDLMLPPRNLNITYTQSTKNQTLNSSALTSGPAEDRQPSEPQYDQAFPLRENITNAVINANRFRWQNNSNYADYREGRQVTPTLPRPPPPPSTAMLQPPGLSETNFQHASPGTGSIMGSSESFNKNESVELGFV